MNCAFCKHPLIFFGTLDPQSLDTFAQVPCTVCGAAFEIGVKVLKQPKYDGAELEARTNKAGK